MMVPAVRAAFTAMLSMGCRVCCDMGRSSSGVGRTSIQACKHAGAGAGGLAGKRTAAKRLGDDNAKALIVGRRPTPLRTCPF